MTRTGPCARSRTTTRRPPARGPARWCTATITTRMRRTMCAPRPACHLGSDSIRGACCLMRGPRRCWSLCAVPPLTLVAAPFRHARSKSCVRPVFLGAIGVTTGRGLHGAQVSNFGNPFLMRVGERETLAQLRPRIQVLRPGLLARLASSWRVGDPVLARGEALHEKPEFPLADMEGTSPASGGLHWLVAVSVRLARCMTARPAAQAKLGVAPEEFGKWRFASLTNLQAPKLLDDQDVVASRFPVKRVRLPMHSRAARG